jgi:hypothetical protein
MDRKHTSCGIQRLKNRLLDHTAATENGTLEDEAMAAGRVFDAVRDLPVGDWVVLCDALKKGLL